MDVKELGVDLEKMGAPSYKMLLTTPMAAIMVSGKSGNEWGPMLQSIAPIYAAAADAADGDIKNALLTAAYVLQGGAQFITKYFTQDNLTFERLMEDSATGADFWMCQIEDGEINKDEAIKLFKSIQSALVETVGDLRDINEMVDQLIGIQDKACEHISTLS